MSLNSSNDREEFSVQVKTCYECDVELKAYNVGKGFILTNEHITPVLCLSVSDLPKALDEATEKLNNSLTLEATMS